VRDILAVSPPADEGPNLERRRARSIWRNAVEQNPYSRPNRRVAPRFDGAYRRFPSSRLLAEAALVIAAAGCAVFAVYLGEVNKWPDFCSYSGWFGVHYLDTFLYAVGSAGNDHIMFAVVGGIWACYAAAAATVLVAAGRCVIPRSLVSGSQ
jgi:hypothetical protein